MSVDSPPAEPDSPVSASADPAALAPAVLDWVALAPAHSTFAALLVPWEPRMLVVDDDELCRRAVQLRLEKLGMVIDVAGDGGEGLDRAATWPYVAVFMDCALPAVDGYRAAREIRSRDGASQHALIVAVTSHPRHVCLAAGMDHHVTKPVRLEDLRTDCARLGLLAPEEEGGTAAAQGAPLLEDAISEPGRNHAETALRFLRRTRRELPELWRAINAKDGSALSRLAGECRDRANTAGAPRVAELFEQLVAASDRRRFNVVSGLETALRGALVETAAAIMRSEDVAARRPVRAPSAVQPIAELPLVPPTAVAPHDPLTPLAPVGPPTPLAPVRVAIADDDPFARGAICAILERAEGVELVAATEGVAEIVASIDTSRPDVVVLDWMMPGGGGGVAAAHTILERWPATRIVALTPANGPEASLEMLRAGASGLVVKGTPPAKLTEMILTIARRPPGHRAATSNWPHLAARGTATERRGPAGSPPPARPPRRRVRPGH
jgi:CheY-like chemotaxis protein